MPPSDWPGRTTIWRASPGRGAIDVWPKTPGPAPFRMTGAGSGAGPEAQAPTRPANPTAAAGPAMPLKVFQDRDHRPADREAGAVERMHMRRPRALLAGRAIARVHPSRLEWPAIRAAGDFAVGILARQPDFDVIRFPGGKPHVAGRQQHDPIRKAEPLQHFFGAAGHALMLGLRILGPRDRHQLDLVELMHADHAASVLTGRPRLRTETRRPGGEPQRQRRFVEYPAADEVGQRPLGGRDHPQPAPAVAD